MDSAVEQLGIPAPHAIKLDVDGIEFGILSGGGRVLAGLQTLSLEVDDAEVEEAEKIAEVLRAAGLAFVSKGQSDLIARSKLWHTVYNHVWERPAS